MLLREEDILRFQELFRKHFKKEISRSDALEQGTHLVKLIEIVIKGEANRLEEGLRQEKDKNGSTSLG